MPTMGTDTEPTTTDLQWLAARELKWYPGRPCFHLISGSLYISAKDAKGGIPPCEFKGCDVSGEIFDHAFVFVRNRPNHYIDVAGVMSAPYLTPDEIRPEAERVAKEFRLKYRVGDLQDDWYGHGTTPLVMWNPSETSLAIVKSSRTAKTG